MEPLSAGDLLAIVSTVHPKMCSSVLEKMIEFTLGVRLWLQHFVCDTL